MIIAVIGGGAAGFFSAICAAESVSGNHEVTILEAGGSILNKVKVSGGGRCNVTNGLVSDLDLSNYYPRGKNSLKRVFSQFSFKDTVSWFEKKGVALKQEPDGRIFPVSNSSQTIIDCLVSAATQAGVVVKNKFKVKSIVKGKKGFELANGLETLFFDKVIVTTGGFGKLRNYDWLSSLGIEIVPPVPSLFTFNIKDKELLKLMGVSVSGAETRIRGLKLGAKGDLLITHWGLSGPAILKLSAFGARMLHDLNYDFVLLVNWIGSNEITIREALTLAIVNNQNKNIGNQNPFSIASSLWLYLVQKASVSLTKKWKELSKKDVNRLINVLVNDEYPVFGKSTFKEEFVTCGGVKSAEIEFNTMESKKNKGLFFAGEVIDVDGVTGGFNFQAAWSTGYVAGLNASQ